MYLRFDQIYIFLIHMGLSLSNLPRYVSSTLFRIWIFRVWMHLYLIWCLCIYSPFWLQKTRSCSTQGSGAMPVKGQPRKAACDVSTVHRCWKDAHSVRRVSVKCDRLFETSSTVGELDEKPNIKFTIKDAVHNQFVLVPLLERMSKHPHHPIPYLKPLAHEYPGLDSNFHKISTYIYEWRFLKRKIRVRWWRGHPNESQNKCAKGHSAFSKSE